MSNKIHKIYWDKNKLAPVILNTEINQESLNNDLTYISTDLRPVFLEELHLIRTVFPKFNEGLFFKSAWATPNGYYLDGKKFKVPLKKEIFKLDNLDALRDKISDWTPTKEMLKSEQSHIDKFIDANKIHINNLLKSTEKDNEGYPVGAEPFIEEQAAKYANRTLVVSFSGGKDSIVVSHLVRKSLNNQSIIHIFGDTTLEQPVTYKFVDEFMGENDSTPFFIEKNQDSNFMDMCKSIGPPSRVKSWCCSVFKTGPMGTMLSEMEMKILTFYGIRRHESVSRSKYDRVTQSPKLKQQIVSAPVIDWLDIDIWLYMFKEKLSFNKAYRQGFTRVGCWCCPNNSEWSDLLAKIYYPELADDWNNWLVEFAKKIGKPDAEEYILTGKWKARQGGAGLDSSNTKVSAKDCVMSDSTAKTYQLTREINDDFFELFKPYGKLDDRLGKKKLGEVHILNDKDEPIFKIIAKYGERSFRVILLMTDSKELNKQYPKKLGTYFWNYIDNQIRKFQSCIYCKACDGVCPVSAIKVLNDKYAIDEKLCTKCLKCINHFSKGCLIASALVTKK